MEAGSLVLHPSNTTNSGYRCVNALQLKGGLWTFEVTAQREGKKVKLGTYKSKLQAAVVFARYLLTSAGPAGGGHTRQGYGNMLIQQAMPDAMDGGKANTIEKVLDMRDVELERDEEGNETVVRVIGGTASGAAADDGASGGGEAETDEGKGSMMIAILDFRF